MYIILYIGKLKVSISTFFSEIFNENIKMAGAVNILSSCLKKYYLNKNKKAASHCKR
jgi:hypothetical protein